MKMSKLFISLAVIGIFAQSKLIQACPLEQAGLFATTKANSIQASTPAKTSGQDRRTGRN